MNTTVVNRKIVFLKDDAGWYADMEGSRGWAVYRTCKSKRRYQSPEIAHKEARQMARRYGKPMGSYYCKFCGGYHLTSKVRHQNRPELVSLEVAA